MMSCNVYLGAKTGEEAYEAGITARRLTLTLLVDLRGEGNRLFMAGELEGAELNAYTQRMHRAMVTDKGLSDRAARQIEESMHLPFGWLDQPYPDRELKRSIARAIRLNRKIQKYGLPDSIVKRSRNTKLAQVEGGITGKRGVSRALYDELVACLKKRPSQIEAD